MRKSYLIVLLGLLTIVLAACGGSDFESESINVYTRDTTSGTRDGFMRGIGFNEAAGSDDVLVDGFVTNNNTGIMAAMTTDTAGIGYISLYSVNDTIKALSFNGVEPTVENVMNDTYALKRPFVFMHRLDFRNETEEALTMAFVAFALTSDGADAINDNGAVATNSVGNWASIRDQHPICQQDNSSFTLNFGGSDSVTRIAEALSAAFSPNCGNVQTVNNHTGSGDGWRRTQGDQKDGVNYMHIGYSSRFFRDGELETDPSGESRYQIAWDAIVAIVHVDNPIDNLTADQLKRIYSGELLTWGDVLND